MKKTLYNNYSLIKKIDLYSMYNRYDFMKV